MGVRYFLIAILLLAACAPQNVAPEAAPSAAPQDNGFTETDLDPELHGQEPATIPNLPDNRGLYQVRESREDYYGDASGFYARPITEEPVPGVVMIHEWWGLNENIEEMARNLASHGYAVFAVDLYNGNVASTPEEATSYMQAADQQESIENMKAATAFLRENEATGVASLGWCFGGAQSLQLSLSDEPLDATVIYYGRLATDAQTLQNIDQPVLGIFASEDGGIPPATVHEFNDTLNSLNANADITIYEGVHHAFANPSGDRYAEEEAAHAWQKTLAFLDENLR